MTSSLAALLLVGAPSAGPILWASVAGDASGSYTDLHFASGSRRLRGVTIGHWVPRWKGFPATDGKAMWLIDGNGNRKPLAWPQPPTESTWSISPSGSLLAQGWSDTENESVQILDQAGNPILEWDREGLARRFGFQNRFHAASSEVAWSPSSRTLAFTTGVGGAPDLSGGTGPTLALLDVASNTVRLHGQGVPVAWVDEDRLLVSTYYETKGDDQDVWVVDRRGRVSRKVYGVIPAGFNGKAIVLLRRHKTYTVLERWTPDLRSCRSRAKLRHPAALGAPDHVRVPG